MTVEPFSVAHLVERLCTTVETELQAFASRETASPPLGMWNGLGGIVAAIVQLQHRAPITAQSEQTCRRYLAMTRRFVSAAQTPVNQGLFSGRVGVLLCASETADFLDCESDRAWIREHTAKLYAHGVQHPTSWLDFSSGVAGMICGAISLARKHDTDCRSLVERLSRQLVQHLELTPVGVSISHTTIETNGPLCGLAHGLSGMAVALLEAGLYLRSEMLEQLAETILNTELQLKHPERLWPDTRITPRDRNPKRRLAAHSENKIWNSASTTWCYGTSGLGMVLSFFAERKKSMQHRRLCESVIDDTLNHIERHGREGKEFCVCHGAGSVLALLNSSKIQRKRVFSCRTSYLPEVDTILQAAIEGEAPGSLVNQAFRSYGLPTTVHPVISRASYFTGFAGLAVVRDQITRDAEPYLLSLPVPL